MSAGWDNPAVLGRDRFSWAVCNWILNHVASKWYRDRITEAVRSGLNSTVQNKEAGNER